MKVLLTGCSSFTGCWFAKKLSDAGVEVVATFTRSAAEDYAESALRHARVQQVTNLCDCRFGTSFGDDRFLAVLAEGDFDALCHHAAYVANYRSPDFDYLAAVRNNTCNLLTVLNALVAGGCNRVVLTGSVFEQDEGLGSIDRLAFSPYGLSKGMTADVFRYYCGQVGLRFDKFVIPNPFGPYEEPRFCNYLMNTWRSGGTPCVRTPAYIRDNIHVELLALAYANFICRAPSGRNSRLAPSGYVESQGDFTHRFAREISNRLDLACPVELAEQSEFPEPRIRFNSDSIDNEAVGFDETLGWDAIADYYRNQCP